MLASTECQSQDDGNEPRLLAELVRRIHVEVSRFDEQRRDAPTKRQPGAGVPPEIRAGVAERRCHVARVRVRSVGVAAVGAGERGVTVPTVSYYTVCANTTDRIEVRQDAHRCAELGVEVARPDADVIVDANRPASHLTVVAYIDAETERAAGGIPTERDRDVISRAVAVAQVLAWQARAAPKSPVEPASAV